MNANFGILPELEAKIRDKKKRYEELVARKNQLNKEQTSFGNNFLETIGIDSGYSDRLKELNKIEQEMARLRN